MIMLNLLVIRTWENLYWKHACLTPLPTLAECVPLLTASCHITHIGTPQYSHGRFWCGGWVQLCGKSMICMHKIWVQSRTECENTRLLECGLRTLLGSWGCCSLIDPHLTGTRLWIQAPALEGNKRRSNLVLSIIRSCIKITYRK